VADEETKISENLRRELEFRFLHTFGRAWLDRNVPALCGRTPRSAAKLKTQRKDLVALLRSFDHPLRRDLICM
jgi:hypothetical protein